jgi:hypothetical protein
MSIHFEANQLVEAFLDIFADIKKPFNFCLLLKKINDFKKIRENSIFKVFL